MWSLILGCSYWLWSWLLWIWGLWWRLNQRTCNNGIFFIIIPGVTKLPNGVLFGFRKASHQNRRAGRNLTQWCWLWPSANSAPRVWSGCLICFIYLIWTFYTCFAADTGSKGRTQRCPFLAPLSWDMLGMHLGLVAGCAGLPHIPPQQRPGPARKHTPAQFTSMVKSSKLPVEFFLREFFFLFTYFLDNYCWVLTT